MSNRILTDDTGLLIKGAIDSLAGLNTHVRVDVAQSFTDAQKQQARENIGAENVANKTTEISASSTDTQYPSAKAVYTSVSDGMSKLTTKTADSTDVGKYAKIKTVTDGKVTEWEFGAGGSSSCDWDDITNKPSEFPPESHTHDDRYYTETETDALLADKYEKPTDGIPDTDLSSDVQTSLGLANTALQTHQSLAAYRTSADQDIIDQTLTHKSATTADMGKYPKVKAIGDGRVIQWEFGSGSTSAAWDDITGKPSTFPPESHTHVKADLSADVQTSLGLADTALQTHQDISGKEDTSNKVTSISSSSTDTQYPSAKSVVDYVDNKDVILTDTSTSKKYKLVVTNGIIGIQEVV